MGGSSETHFTDRRHFPRYPCKGSAEILQSGKPWGWGAVSDISCGGCYIETMHPLPAGTEAQLRLSIAGIFLDICARVVSSDPMFGMGMGFLVAPTEQMDRLPQIIEKITDAVPSPVAQQAELNYAKAQPSMEAALQHLKQAQKELQEAMRGKDGNHALQLTGNAIHEVQKALNWGSTIEPTDTSSFGSGFGCGCEVH